MARRSVVGVPIVLVYDEHQEATANPWVATAASSNEILPPEVSNAMPVVQVRGPTWQTAMRNMVAAFGVRGIYRSHDPRCMMGPYPIVVNPTKV